MCGNNDLSVFFHKTRPVYGVRESKTVLDSWFHAVDFRNAGTRVLDASLCHVNLDSGFQYLLGFRIPQAKFSRIRAGIRIPCGEKTV